MTENKKNFNAFLRTSLADWESVAREELKGAEPHDKLMHKGEGWSIAPYYDSYAVKYPAPLLPPTEKRFLGPRTWYNCPSIFVKEASEANQWALECLQQGADGILFVLEEKVNMEILFRDIKWTVCSLNFLVKKDSEEIAEAINVFITKNIPNNYAIQGAFYGNLAPGSFKQGAFRFSGFRVPSSPSPVEEISSAFAWLVQTGLKNFSDHASEVAFSVTLGTDFFLELAKLRAYRLIWSKFLQATRSKQDVSLVIHAHSLPWTQKEYEPHANMLKGTTAAMAGILGGCNHLTIDPERDDRGRMSRAARNVSNLLREESYFSKVADPTAGSYFLEDLTSQLAESAWKNIQRHLPQ